MSKKKINKKSKNNLEKILSKFEKYWRNVSGIKKSNIKDNMDLSSPKEKNNINDQAMNEANELKKNFFLQSQNMLQKDLLIGLVERNIKNENDIENLNEKDWDDICREVKVARQDELKDQKSKANLENILSKFEKHWRNVSGIKKSNIKGDLDDDKKDDAPKEKNNKKMEANAPLKKWMQEHNVWEKDLFDTLLANKITNEEDLKNLDEPKFDEIVRKVRVERVAAIKDQATRTRLDKLLTNFEKEWRSLSGIKKTAIKKKD